jgi:hypothetical protein
MLVSFQQCLDSEATPNRSHCDAKASAGGTPPTVASYTTAVTDFISKFPGVGYYTPWNEPNRINDQPTGSTTAVSGLEQYNAATSSYSVVSNSAGYTGAQMAGQYYVALISLCGNTAQTKCHVAAGDFLDSDMGNATSSSYGQTYYAQYKAEIGGPPPEWAWHVYSDAQATTSCAETSAGTADRWKRLRAFLTATQRTDGASSPPVWITETGPFAYDPSASPPIHNSEAQQAQILREILGDMPSISSRITRVYDYGWTGIPTIFDTGLLRPDSDSYYTSNGIVKYKPPSYRTSYYVFANRTKYGPIAGTGQKCG